MLWAGRHCRRERLRGARADPTKVWVALLTDICFIDKVCGSRSGGDILFERIEPSDSHQLVGGVRATAKAGGVATDSRIRPMHLICWLTMLANSARHTNYLCCCVHIEQLKTLARGACFHTGCSASLSRGCQVPGGVRCQHSDGEQHHQGQWSPIFTAVGPFRTRAV